MNRESICANSSNHHESVLKPADRGSLRHSKIVRCSQSRRCCRRRSSHSHTAVYLPGPSVLMKSMSQYSRSRLISYHPGTSSRYHPPSGCVLLFFFGSPYGIGKLRLKPLSFFFCWL